MSEPIISVAEELEYGFYHTLCLGCGESLHPDRMCAPITNPRVFINPLKDSETGASGVRSSLVGEICICNRQAVVTIVTATTVLSFCKDHKWVGGA